MVLMGDLLTGHLKGECNKKSAPKKGKKGKGKGKKGGKPFSAPEQISGKANSPPVDIYQLGLLWAQLIKGSPMKEAEKDVKPEPFSCLLGKSWDLLIESMLA